jgi:O-antigen/teichoic acid export membrane protein
VWISLSSAILTVLLALFLVPRHSVEGVIAAVLLVQIILTLPLSVYLWFKYNNKWRE